MPYFILSDDVRKDFLMPEGLIQTNESGFICDPSALFVLIGQVVELCVDSNLIVRQASLTQFHAEYAPIAQGATIELATIDGQYTKIGNVEQIGPGAHISSGAQVAAHCIVKSRVTIGECAIIDEFVRLDHGSIVEKEAHIGLGASLAIGSSCGERSIVCEGTEVGYDVAVPPDTKIEPYHIATRGANDIHTTPRQ